jgi:hypothetical protein
LGIRARRRVERSCAYTRDPRTTVLEPQGRAQGAGFEPQDARRRAQGPRNSLLCAPKAQGMSEIHGPRHQIALRAPERAPESHQINVVPWSSSALPSNMCGLHGPSRPYSKRLAQEGRQLRSICIPSVQSKRVFRPRLCEHRAHRRRACSQCGWRTSWVADFYGPQPKDLLQAQPSMQDH